MEFKLKVGSACRMWIGKTAYAGEIIEVLNGWVAMEFIGKRVYINLALVEFIEFTLPD